MRGTIQTDPLKEYIAQKEYIFPPRPSMRLITDIFAFCSKEVPKWNTISVSGYHIREAGSTAAQELAFLHQRRDQSSSRAQSEGALPLLSCALCGEALAVPCREPEPRCRHCGSRLFRSGQSR